MLFDEEAEDRRHPPPSILARVVLGIVLTVLAVLVLTVVLGAWWAHDVTTPDDGDGYAQELSERAAVVVADHIEEHYSGPLHAETLAERALEAPRPDDADDAAIELRVLGAHGATADPDGARVDLAVSVGAPEWSDGAVFGHHRTAGRATTCWHLVARAYEKDDTADIERFDCPAGVAAQPALGSDAGGTVVDVLNGLPVAVDPTSAEAALRYEFPSSVGVAVEWQGKELVAAVGVVGMPDCVVAVRKGGAAEIVPDVDPALLEHGGPGCVPSLYGRSVATR